MNRIIPSAFTRECIKQILLYQFLLSPEELEKFIPSNIEVELSKNTKRLRYIYLKEELWGVIRPNDGFFLLTPSSAKFLIEILESPKLRVIVQSDVAEYIQEGRNVFAKHVVDCDPNLIPFSEIIVVDEKDTPLAIGKAIFNREEMLAFNNGVAVKVRKKIKEI